jgi:hypothetical protein
MRDTKSRTFQLPAARHIPDAGPEFRKTRTFVLYHIQSGSQGVCLLGVVWRSNEKLATLPEYGMNPANK